MPPAPVKNHIGLPFLVLDRVDSTNNYAMGRLHAGLASHGEAYFALDQFAGRGQRGKVWNAVPGENITISIILSADFPNNQFPFLLSASVALSCLDLLLDHNVDELSVKWPNDIYWRDRKAGGILIESLYRSNEWRYAVVGIGLNINQTQFSNDENVPVSLKQITGNSYDPVALAQSSLCAKLNDRYNHLFERAPNTIIEEYNNHLYKKDQEVKLKKGNIVFETTIGYVSLSGDLHTSDTIERNFAYGEVDWVTERTPIRG